ncbi:MAG: chromate transporter [Candidatus Saccharimonadales bacterium]
MVDLLAILVHIGIISLTSYSGSAQGLFYEIGVTQLHWITNQDYVSYLGFGFASPGPQAFSPATFIGYGKSVYWSVVWLSTFAIYTMPVTLAILSGRYLKKWINKPVIQHFVHTVGVASAGLLVAIGIKILAANELSLLYALIAVGAAIAVNKKVNPLIIIGMGLLLGLFVR